MRAIFYTTLLLLISCVTVQAGDIKNAVTVRNTTIHVSTGSWAAETVELTITDKAGKILLKETIASSLGDFRLSNLPEGHYQMSTADNYKIQYLDFHVDNEGIHTADKSDTYYKPMIHYKDGALFIRFKTGNHPAVLHIYDEKARRVKTVDYKKGNIEVQQDLKGLKRGKYVAYIGNAKTYRVVAFKK